MQLVNGGKLGEKKSLTDNFGTSSFCLFTRERGGETARDHINEDLPCYKDFRKNIRFSGNLPVLELML